MASYQRVALYILFDSIESDLIEKLRTLASPHELILTEEERDRARTRLESRTNPNDDAIHEFELLTSLDLGDKVKILMRLKSNLSDNEKSYYKKISVKINEAIKVRNAVMHGRPLTVSEVSKAFALAEELLRNKSLWPRLASEYGVYADNPDHFLSKSITLLDDDYDKDTLHNLPAADYDDTGFIPRPKLESDLRKKLLGRHPVVTVLGDGGNGKSALAVQVLYSLVHSVDHDFDAIVWVSAKSSKLTTNEIVRIEGAITDSLGLFQGAVEVFDESGSNNIEKLRKLLTDNKILLCVDNLETVIDESIQEFAADVPGESKILFTSRVPLGSDLAVQVDTFDESEALQYLHRLIAAYDIVALKGRGQAEYKKYIRRLAFKPLLIKWFALGVVAGLPPERIIRDPAIALKYCMENVVERLSRDAQEAAAVLAVVPAGLSVGTLAHVSGLSAQQCEAALAELLRFALIERDERAKYERLMCLKPFAKSYVTRMFAKRKADVENILDKLKRVEGAYQTERGHDSYNRYDVKTYAVRSRGEAVAVKEIRKSVAFAIEGKYDLADEKIEELKVTHPDYFEVYRSDAFIAYRQGDVGRAAESFETAISLASDQPQLYVYYAGFLMRIVGDYDGAAKQLEEAVRLDTESAYVFMESARSYFMLSDFCKAQEKLDKAWKLDRKTFKEETIIRDLQAQCYYRRADHCNKTGNFDGCIAAIEDLCRFVCDVDVKYIDKIFLTHLEKVYLTIDSLRLKPAFATNTVLDEIEKALIALGAMRSSEGTVEASSTRHSSKDGAVLKTGYLKEEGRQASFGFMRSTDGEDTFLHMDNVSHLIWHRLCEGAAAVYEVESNENGKTYAKNIQLQE